MPSKKKAPLAVSGDPPKADLDVRLPVADSAIPEAGGFISLPKLRIFIVFYSMYGHVEILARRIKVGVDSIDGVEGVLFRVPETMPPKVLEQMRVPQRAEDVPVMSAAAELAEADGVLFGFPTRYGTMAAQMKSFFDSTGQLWREQNLAGVPAGFFVSSGTQGGGQETTA